MEIKGNSTNFEDSIDFERSQSYIYGTSFIKNSSINYKPAVNLKKENAEGKVNRKYSQYSVLKSVQNPI